MNSFVDSSMILIEINDLKFPKDTQKLVSILNKLKFRNLDNWFAYKDSFVVFSPNEKNTHYTDIFMQQLLIYYLETKEYIERILSKLNPSPIVNFWVDEDYYFRLSSENELFQDFVGKQLNPSQCAREFAKICRELHKK
jgi:hypothetical protein